MWRVTRGIWSTVVIAMWEWSSLSYRRTLSCIRTGYHEFGVPVALSWIMSTRVRLQPILLTVGICLCRISVAAIVCPKCHMTIVSASSFLFLQKYTLGCTHLQCTCGTLIELEVCLSLVPLFAGTRFLHSTIQIGCLYLVVYDVGVFVVLKRYWWW